ncbi:hypothetical protein Tco_0319652 [Tanacetum coccineum]
MSAGHKEVQKGCLDSLFRDKEKRGGVVIRIEDSRSVVVDAVVDGYDANTLSPHKFVGGPGSSGILLMNEALYELKYSYIENMRIYGEVAELVADVIGILAAAIGAAREVDYIA